MKPDYPNSSVRLLSDKGSRYISERFGDILERAGVGHFRREPNHPQTQGTIKRYHRSIKLDNYNSPGEKDAQIVVLVDFYNPRRFHKSLSNVSPADVWFGRDQKILRERASIKAKALWSRKVLNLKNKAKSVPQYLAWNAHFGLTTYTFKLNVIYI